MMQVLIIPLASPSLSGNFFFCVDLSGVEFQLDFSYNDREGRWYFNLLDASGKLLRAGVKLVSNFPLLHTYVGASRPVGEVLALDTRAYPIDPDLYEFGKEIELAYVEIA